MAWANGHTQGATASIAHVAKNPSAAVYANGCPMGPKHEGRTKLSSGSGASRSVSAENANTMRLQVRPRQSTALGWLDTVNPKEERSGAIGLGTILAGGHGLVVAHLDLGSQGNPRRYAAYLDTMEGWIVLHGLAALAGTILLVGCVTVVLSLKDRGRPDAF